MERLGATSGNLVVVRITKVMIAATNHTGNYGVSGRHCKGALKNPIFRPAHPISGRPTPSPATSQPFSGSPASIYLLVFAFIYVYILFFFPLQFFLWSFYHHTRVTLTVIITIMNYSSFSIRIRILYIQKLKTTHSHISTVRSILGFFKHFQWLTQRCINARMCECVIFLL